MHAYKPNGKDTYGIGNEKAWLKQNQLAPALCIHNVSDSEPEDRNTVSDKEIFYIRALLGIGDRLLFKNPQGVFPSKTTVSVKCTEKDPNNIALSLIERYSSPIRFKVIDNTVYYTSYPLDERILGCTFQFTSNYNGTRRSMTLKTPTKEVLGEQWRTIVERFLVYAYLNYFKNNTDDYLGVFNETNGIHIEGRCRT